MPDRLTEAAPAKVNLYLHVTGRRDDGYHLLDSLVVFAEIGDVLGAEPAETLSLRVAGPFAGGLAAEPDNLVLRAARALAAEAGVPPGAHLVLDKHLPVASGIGGGSADAAAALRLLCRLWGLSPSALCWRGWRLGSAPMCRPACRPHVPHGRDRRASGARAGAAGVWHRAGQSGDRRGHGRRVPRPARRLVGPAALPAGWADSAAMAADLGQLRNDLEPAAVALRPVIADVLAALAAAPGCLLARMSGSGATCFGLFARSPTWPGVPSAICESPAGGAGPVRCGADEQGFTWPGTRPMHARLPDGA